jgi:hypothetical protein
VSFLAACSAYRRKIRPTAEGRLETRVAALHTEYHYAKSLDRGVLPHRPWFRVFVIHDGVSVGHNTFGHIFRRRKTASQQPAVLAQYLLVDSGPDGSYIL